MDNISAQRKLFLICIAVILVVVGITFLVVRVAIPKYQYYQAEALMGEQRYEEAAAAFQALNGYEDSTERALLCEERAGDKDFLENTVQFGSYSGKPIEWIILDTDGDKTLLISKEVLDEQPYNEENDFVTWEICTIRAWLNDDFYQSAFNEEEQSRIATTHLVNENSSVYGTAGGNDTDDKVFFLTVSDVRKYMPGRGNRTATTHWWLRDPGSNAAAASDVRADGTICVQGYFVWRADSGVRPAIWVHLD